MSRNFELLQNLGREREMFEAPLESAPPAPVATASRLEEPVMKAVSVPVEVHPLQLQNGGVSAR